jgi:predicted nucleotidyltransferase
MKVDIQYLKDRGLIVFEAIMGSFAYGTNTPESDVDIRGIYVQDLDSILGMGYVEQVSDDKNDITYYEIRRFVELVRVNNPNIIELLNVPKDCIRVYNP